MMMVYVDAVGDTDSNVSRQSGAAFKHQMFMASSGTMVAGCVQSRAVCFELS